ncbi:GCN5-related N-acetyltransferase [Glaciecola punicea ACAM 611]|jgi:GNAT superfamily N-acetyltransferase|uniref:GCN5-related N-acetyltransferase n=1 Tax=Glaciecola punicea ACAM 611 TaxID=1121923 RepID=H5TAJ5_9ALTE|nr:GNAT family N-acetyltransferase [Glaciecola punicea]GAB55322.1 GCN5-related N-acetyltransferase [Glaciecola punicea ACAM 611]
MSISFKRSIDLQKAAQFTFDNMYQYYQRLAPDWDVAKVLQATEDLENYDILYNHEVVGVLRLQFEGQYCYLRDLQVVPTLQNKGIGKAALNEAKRRTLNANLTTLTLRVLKISPALTLYERNGFVIQAEDERFFNMAAELSQSVS